MLRRMTTAYVSMLIVLTFHGSASMTSHDLTDPALIIEEGFESGEFPFTCSGNCPAIIKVKDAPAGNYVMKPEINQSSEDFMRAEASVSGRIVNFDVGKEYWVGISIQLGR